MPEVAVLSDCDVRLLRLIARMIVPADEGLGVPGADDGVIFADIVASLGMDRDAVRGGLAAIRRHGAPLADMDEAGVAELVDAWRNANRAEAMLFVRVVVQCYYRDDRVLRSLGVDPRPPFPLGHKVEEVDNWSLLDAVRARGRIWRSVAATTGANAKSP